MRLTRLVAGATTASLLGLAPLALTTGTAHAADKATVTTIKAFNPLVTFKGASPHLLVEVDLVDSDSSIYGAGTVTLFARPANAKKWKKVRTVAASDSVPLIDVVPKRTTQYRAEYSGGSSEGYGTFAPSSSKTVKVRVSRKLTATTTLATKGLVVKGRVAPKYAKKKIVVHKRVGAKWKKFRTLKTNKKSRFSVVLPKKRATTKYRVTVPGNKQYAKTTWVRTV